MPQPTGHQSPEFARLQRLLQQSPLDISESLCRKYVARHRRDIRGWLLLLELLLGQNNRREVQLMAQMMVSAIGETGAAGACMPLLFRAGAFREALDIGRRLSRDEVGNDPKYFQMMDELQLLFGDIQDLPVGNDADRSSAILAREFNRNTKRSPGTSAEVVFYLQRGWHYSIQHDIAKALQARGVKCVLAQSLEIAVALRPCVLVISEALYGRLQFVRDSLPDCTIVNTRHGLGDKNHAAIGASQADFICVSSDHVGHILEEELLVPRNKIWVTGYPEMDHVFRNASARKEEFKGACPSVLFAPTFTPGLSAGPLLAERLVEYIRGKDDHIEVHIRPHPHLTREKPSLVGEWRSVAEKAGNVFLHTDETTSVMSLFPLCDIMISDVSSAGLAWLAVDRPLICIVDPQAAEKSARSARDGLEWKMHEAAIVVENVADINRAVVKSLADPNYLRGKRREMRDLLFGGMTDGAASLRIASRIETLLVRRRR